jgi:hypothetical protein
MSIEYLDKKGNRFVVLPLRATLAQPQDIPNYDQIRETLRANYAPTPEYHASWQMIDIEYDQAYIYGQLARFQEKHPNDPTLAFFKKPESERTLEDALSLACAFMSKATGKHTEYPMMPNIEQMINVDTAPDTNCGHYSVGIALTLDTLVTYSAPHLRNKYIMLRNSDTHTSDLASTSLHAYVTLITHTGKEFLVSSFDPYFEKQTESVTLEKLDHSKGRSIRSLIRVATALEQDTDQIINEMIISKRNILLNIDPTSLPIEEALTLSRFAASEMGNIEKDHTWALRFYEGKKDTYTRNKHKQGWNAEGARRDFKEVVLRRRLVEKQYRAATNAIKIALEKFNTSYKRTIAETIQYTELMDQLYSPKNTSETLAAIFTTQIQSLKREPRSILTETAKDVVLPHFARRLPLLPASLRTKEQLDEIDIEYIRYKARFFTLIFRGKISIVLDKRIARKGTTPAGKLLQTCYLEEKARIV